MKINIFGGEKCREPKRIKYETPTKTFCLNFVSQKTHINREFIEKYFFQQKHRFFLNQKLQIVDISSCFRPIFMEQFQPPDLRIDAIENNGCPFAGFDKRTERKRRRASKDSKPKKGMSIDICHLFLWMYFQVNAKLL